MRNDFEVNYQNQEKTVIMNVYEISKLTNLNSLSNTKTINFYKTSTSSFYKSWYSKKLLFITKNNNKDKQISIVCFSTKKNVDFSEDCQSSLINVKMSEIFVKNQKQFSANKKTIFFITGLVSITSVLLSKLFQTQKIISEKQNFQKNDLNSASTYVIERLPSNQKNLKLQNSKKSLSYNSKFASIGFLIHQNNSFKLEYLINPNISKDVKELLQNTFFKTELNSNLNVIFNIVTGNYCLYSNADILNIVQPTNSSTQKKKKKIKVTEFKKIRESIYNQFIEKNKNTSEKTITLTWDSKTNHSSFIYDKDQDEKHISSFKQLSF